jgi:methylene-tetrahydromethanopterin dehydrogenase
MSTAKPILHMLSPLKHTSPFDVNMAADAGFEVIVPYVGVTTEDVTALVQDAIFSRPPQDGVRTGVFVGGKDAILALDMMEAARAAMVPPFQVSVMGDPAGSFTTAAAMVACVERTLRQRHGRPLEAARIAVIGATGVVGFAASVIAALEGARVTLIAHRGFDRVVRGAAVAKERFGVDLTPAAGETVEQRRALLSDAEIVLAAAAAGIQVVSADDLGAAPSVLIAADVNAVPPAGVEGMEPFMDGTAVLLGTSAVGIGPLAIGDVKYRTEAGLFRRMIAADAPLHLDFRHAFTLARSLVA